MESGSIFALLAAMVFGSGQVLVRRATHQLEGSFTVSGTCTLLGFPLSIITLSLMGDWDRLLFLSWQGYVRLGIAGVLNLAIGRYLYFTGIRLIGSSRSAIISRIEILLSVIFGIIFLHEAVTIQLILGALCIMFGAILVSYKGGEGNFKILDRGVLFVMLTALVTAVSAVLIKPAMEEIGSPYAAAVIGYGAASLPVGLVFIFGKQQRARLFKLGRTSLLQFIAISIMFTGAHLLKYAALSISSVSVVQSLMGGLMVIFVFLFSFIINRKIDIFTWRIFIGVGVVVAGVFLIF